MTSYRKYLNRPNAAVSASHSTILEKGEEMTQDFVLPRSEVNKLLDPAYLSGEDGFRREADGSTYVSVLTKMPKVSIEMIDWWFWWHAAEGPRYQIWYPEMHYDIAAEFKGHYHDESKTYRERLHLSTHLVTEDVGVGKDKILIDFMSPGEFGFDESRLHPEKETIICARVGSPDKGVWGTEMCHFVRTTKEGVEMRSRFWIGHQVYRMGGFAQGLLNAILNKSFVKRKLLPRDIGIKMFHHCSQEYHNLAELLPLLYSEERGL
ncbi:MAG: hypothetical protein KTR30_20395 [Saprospiraceae bacterium]|nr:hypothetical protein [Saprospiraceae bacterium]